MIFEFLVYGDLFSLWQGDKSLEDYYSHSHFKGMIDEFNQYLSVTNDIEIFKKQREELYICFFRGSVLNLKTFWGQLLAGEEGIPA